MTTKKKKKKTTTTRSTLATCANNTMSEWKKDWTHSVYVGYLVVTFVLTTLKVIDGLPVVNAEQKPKLIKFLLKKLNTAGKTREDAIFMPMNDKDMSEG